MSYLEQKYIHLVGNRLRNFRKIPNGFRWSCPYCGDSQKDRTKARGYMLTSSGTYHYYCHNCNISTNFYGFLKDQFPEYLKEYNFEKFKKDQPVKKEQYKIEALFDSQNELSLKYKFLRCDEIEDTHIAKSYLNSRKIPKEKYKDIYYTEDMNRLKTVFTNYQDTVFYKEPRLIIPVYDKNKSLIAAICRDIQGKSKNKYITLKKNEDANIIYGIEKIDNSKTVYVLEGPIDSFFLENSIAVSGSNLKKCSEILDKSKTVYIFDNQPRNKQILRNMEILSDKHNVVIWPESIIQKDINEMYLADIDFIKIIKENTYNGLNAKLQIAKWRKI